MPEEPFLLEIQEIKPSLRMKMKALVREIGKSIPAGSTDKQVRRIFRINRPLETYDNEWTYKVYREEVRRLMGLAVGPMEKRTVEASRYPKSTQDWLRRKGFKIYNDAPFKGSPGT